MEAFIEQKLKDSFSNFKSDLLNEMKASFTEKRTISSDIDKAVKRAKLDERNDFELNKPGNKD